MESGVLDKGDIQNIYFYTFYFLKTPVINIRKLNLEKNDQLNKKQISVLIHTHSI